MDKYFAIYGGHDIPARAVLQAYRNAGLKVPDNRIILVNLFDSQAVNRADIMADFKLYARPNHEAYKKALEKTMAGVR